MGSKLMSRSTLWLLSIRLSLVIVGSFIIAPPSSADVRLPNIFGSSMVLQRDMPLPIWGWASPGEDVRVEFTQHEVAIQANDQGKWMARLPAVKAGGPFQMTVSGKNRVRLTDILVGEVWICAGQSNMEWSVNQVPDAEHEKAAANYSEMRLFLVPIRACGLPVFDVNARWSSCQPNTIGGFSAVAYYFGREILQNLRIPVGLIQTTRGSPIEAWTPSVGFEREPRLQYLVKQIADANHEYNQAIERAICQVEQWIPVARKALASGDIIPAPPNWPLHPLYDEIGEGHPSFSGYPWNPTVLYNGMVRPLAPFAIRGAIWYQGEGNVHKDFLENSDEYGVMYNLKMRALIGGWRQVWGQGDFPFYFVQLAPYRYGLGGLLTKLEEDPLRLPKIWEAQTAALSVPNTGMVVTTDIGDVTDIHPRNKQDVGKRLALWALAKNYGRSELVFSGPLYRAMSLEGQKVRLYFDHVGSGLTSRDGKPLTWFEISGGDKKFVGARASIEGETVLVWSETVTAPVAVRFGWHEQAQPNLANKEGLPASPFRTDRW